MTLKAEIAVMYGMLDALDRLGWAQNAFRDEQTGSVCYVGAFIEATQQWPPFIDSNVSFNLNHFPQAILAQFKDPSLVGLYQVMQFNDDQSTSEEDVRLSLKKAIEDAEAAEEQFASWRSNG